MCGRGTMQSPIDFLNKSVELVSNLGRLKRSYKPAYAKRERKSSSTASYLIIWLTPLTIKHSLIRTKSCYIHGSFNHFIFNLSFFLFLNIHITLKCTLHVKTLFPFFYMYMLVFQKIKDNRPILLKMISIVCLTFL